MKLLLQLGLSMPIPLHFYQGLMPILLHDLEVLMPLLQIVLFQITLSKSLLKSLIQIIILLII